MRDYEIYEPDGRTKIAVSNMRTADIQSILTAPQQRVEKFDDGTGPEADPPLCALIERLRLELEIRALEHRL